MPTATAAPTVTETLAELPAAHEEAKADLSDVEQHAHSYRSRVHGLRTKLLERSIDHPVEFTDTGSPKPKSEAAKLSAEIVKLTEADGFDSLIEVATERVERARIAARRVVEEDGRQLLLDLVPDAQDAVDAFAAWAGEGHQHLERLADLQHRATSICHVSRAYDTRDFDLLDHWSSLVIALAKSSPALPLPRQLILELKVEADNE